MPNIEIKARCGDLERARRTALRLGARSGGTLRQTDTYFATKAGRFKLRESEDGAQLIPYHRPDRSGPKKSDYLLIPVDEPARCKTLLRKLLGAEAVVKKTRRVLLLDNVRVHLDLVAGLGSFIEFEAVYDDPRRQPREKAKVAELLREFGVASKDLLTGSYREMMMSARSR